MSHSICQINDTRIEMKDGKLYINGCLYGTPTKDFSLFYFGLGMLAGIGATFIVIILFFHLAQSA